MHAPETSYKFYIVYTIKVNSQLEQTMVPLRACLSQFRDTTVVLLSTLLIISIVQAGDPDILTDYVVPNGAVPDSSFFLFRGLNNSLRGAPKYVHFKLTKANRVKFPALEGQSVSYTVFQYAPKGVNAPHTHPRSAELFLVLKGSLKVGFIDSTNKLFVQLLQTGDMFLFPKGLVHFQVNMSTKNPAVAISAFGSSDPGTISLPGTLFRSGIASDVLAKSFKTDIQTIQDLVLDDCHDYGGGGGGSGGGSGG